MTAKDPNRPRAAHKLNLQPGDVVRLVAWQSAATKQAYLRDVEFTVGKPMWGSIGSQRNNPKGSRPLFTVISRAADAKPDEVKTTCDENYRYTRIFSAGSDIGTVTREKL